MLLPGAKGATEVLVSGDEERFDVVRLEPGGFSAIHLAAHLLDFAAGEHCGNKLLFGEHFIDPVPDVRVHNLEQPGL